VPLLLNLDNFKAAVLKADWFDPEINPKLADFCRHYGMHVVPCRPATPQHKGKIERGVAYLRANALKGRCFKSLAELNGFLAHWESSVADQRIHGTTRKQVAACFEEERPHLQPLPASLFPCYQEAQRNVHRDSYVEVERAFYEVPPELIGHQVWVRWDSRCVRILNERLEQVALHTRLEAGKFSRSLGACGLSGPVLSRVPLLGQPSGGPRRALRSMGPGSPRPARARGAALHYGAVQSHQEAFGQRAECRLHQGAPERHLPTQRPSPAHWRANRADHLWLRPESPPHPGFKNLRRLHQPPLPTHP
jgi:hypothetical protein